MKNITLLFILFFTHSLLQNVFSQSVHIISLKIIPENPTKLDEIRTVCHTIFPTSPNQLFKDSFHITDNIITLDLTYNIGGATVVTERIDTFNFGYLLPGEYQIIATARVTHDSRTDKDTVKFNVGYPLNLNEKALMNDVILKTNQGSRTITIESTRMIDEIQIFSISGKNTLTNKNINNKLYVINSQLLDQGVYLLIISDYQGNRYYRKINHFN